MFDECMLGKAAYTQEASTLASPSQAFVYPILTIYWAPLKLRGRTNVMLNGTPKKQDSKRSNRQTIGFIVTNKIHSAAISKQSVSSSYRHPVFVSYNYVQVASNCTKDNHDLSTRFVTAQVAPFFNQQTIGSIIIYRHPGVRSTRETAYRRMHIYMYHYHITHTITHLARKYTARN